ncbi:MAG: alanine dehydrogenase [Deltaproteobacteria bacterium]|jgi:alanine dehydrogenase|nr:alanine dehydrogenase [Deltaproteobacteria bacterium]
MIIGVPKEIKTQESRVSVRPDGVKQLVAAGHRVLVEHNAGIKSGFTNEDYISAGGTLENSAETIWNDSNMIIKVKEPLESEYKYFRSDLNLFTYLHLASVPQLAKALCETNVTSIGYETVETDDHQLPLLIPMSEVAGRVGTQVGTYLLHKNHGGKGLLLGGVTGTRPGTVVVIGGGHVGLNSAEVAAGLRADTIVLDISDDKLNYIEKKYKGAIKPVKSTPESISEWVSKADLLVGAVLVAGDRAPHVVKEEHVKAMQWGSVIVDVAIDQGGCIETIRATSHDEPTYVMHNVIHYAVPNMPALTPYTSTEALTSATFPYALKLANEGIEAALTRDPVLAKGLQTKNGKVTLPVLQKLFPNLA